MFLKNKDIELRKLKLTNINNEYLNWFNDISISRFINNKPKDITSLLKYYNQTIKKKKNIFLGIFYKKKHIGNLRVHNFNNKNSSAYLGIMIGNQKFRSKNIGSKSIDLIKDFLFYKMKINNIFLGVNKKNLKAINFYKKKNFLIYKEKKNIYVMKLNIFHEKLIIGTAQFNSTYGVTNFKSKKLGSSELTNIINLLNNNLIIHYDLAENYLFKLKKKFLMDNYIIDNKLTSIKTKNLKKIQYFISRLKKKYNFTFDTLYLHDGDNLFSKEGTQVYNFLQFLKKKKLIKNIGLSLYSLKKINKILKEFNIDVIQFPYNILDRRIEKKITLLKKNKVKIYVRSIFLQGSLLKRVENNQLLSETYSFFQKKAIACKEKKLCICLNHAFSNPGIDKVIIGIRSQKELKMILNQKIYPKNYNLKFPKKLINDVIDPRKW